MIGPITVKLEGGMAERDRAFVHKVGKENGGSQLTVSSYRLKDLHGLEMRKVIEDAFEYPYRASLRNKTRSLELLKPVTISNVSGHSDQRLCCHRNLLLLCRSYCFLYESGFHLQELGEVYFKDIAFLQAAKAWKEESLQSNH